MRECQERTIDQNRKGNLLVEANIRKPSSEDDEENKSAGRPCFVGLRRRPINSIKRKSNLGIPNNIFMDSSVSEHVVSDPAFLPDAQQVPDISVELPDGQRGTQRQRGKLIADVGCERIILSAVYYITSMNLNILSCFRLDERGVTTTIRNGKCILTYKKIMYHLHTLLKETAIDCS